MTSHEALTSLRLKNGFLVFNQWWMCWHRLSPFRFSLTFAVFKKNCCEIFSTFYFFSSEKNCFAQVLKQVIWDQKSSLSFFLSRARTNLIIFEPEPSSSFPVLAKVKAKPELFKPDKLLIVLFLVPSPRSHGQVVRAVTCKARGPGFDSSSDQMFFFSPRVSGGSNKKDPGTKILCDLAYPCR